MNLFIKTTIDRDLDWPDFLHVHVGAYKSDQSKKMSGGKASLSGFVINLPGSAWIDSVNFDFFDSYGVDAEAAHLVLSYDTSKISAALSIKLNELKNFEKVTYLVSVKVKSKYRGNRLALRLMRELSYIFKGSKALFILKANPIKKDASGDECRALAEYYLSDPALSYTPIDSVQLPGWLVGTSTLEIERTNDRSYVEV